MVAALVVIVVVVLLVLVLVLMLVVVVVEREKPSTLATGHSGLPLQRAYLTTPWAPLAPCRASVPRSGGRGAPGCCSCCMLGTLQGGSASTTTSSP